MPYKFLLLMNGPRGHATETYWTNDANDNVAKMNAVDLALARSNTLGLGAEVSSVRLQSYDANLTKKISTVGVLYREPLRALPWFPSFAAIAAVNPLVLSNPMTNNQKTSWGADIRGVSNLLELTLQRGVNVTTKARQYMAYNPDMVNFTATDPVIINGSDDLLALQTWKVTVCDEFFRTLQNTPFSKRIRDTTYVPDQILDVASGNPTASPEVFASVFIEGDKRGTYKTSPAARIQIKGRRHRRFAGRQKELNGKWLVYDALYDSVKNRTQIFMVCTINTVVDRCLPLGTVEPVKYQLGPITGVELLYATERRRGRRVT